MGINANKKVTAEELRRRMGTPSVRSATPRRDDLHIQRQDAVAAVMDMVDTPSYSSSYDSGSSHSSSSDSGSSCSGSSSGGD